MTTPANCVPDSAATPWRDRLLVSVFLLALTLPGLALISTWSRSTTTFENRSTATWPALGAPGFASAFERALADRFGGRDLLIQLHHFTKAVVFGVSPVPTVLLGERGWLFYKGDDASAVDRVYRRVPPPSHAETSALAEAIAARHRYLAARGIRYLLVVVPDKYTIYPEHMPAALRPRTAVSPFDALLSTLEPPLRARVVDLRAAMAAAKPARQLYYRTDSHWNNSGGWLGYQELLRALRSDANQPTPPYPPVLPERQVAEMTGDLSKMIGVSFGFEEPAFTLQYPPDVVPCAKDPNGKPAAWGAKRQLLRCESASLGKAVIYHDSMGYQLTALLSHNLRQSLWVEARQWNLADIESLAPDVVIDEVVERNLHLIADAQSIGHYGSRERSPSSVTTWIQGHPQGLSQQAHSTASCALDAINGHSAIDGQPIPLGAQLSRFEGWAANMERALLPEMAWLLLHNDTGSLYAPLTLGLPRPDVASASQKPGLKLAGFRASMDDTSVPPGDYRIAVVWVDANGWSRCDTRRKVTVSRAPR